MDNIYLHIPIYEELSYRQNLLSQPETMSYNANYDIIYEGYHKDTGCIDFPKSKWRKWFSYWIDNKPQCFYAYIVRKTDDKFIGEVNFRYNKEKDWYEMGIVIESTYRGKGYSQEALRKLLVIAFINYNAKAVYNSFEKEREFAYKLHLNAGFKLYNEKDNIKELILSRENYQK
jgi:hypothetical protein